MTSIAYIGNFGPAHSTENHVAADAEALGYEVERWQENDPETWDRDLDGIDVVLWTRTGWDWPKVCGWTVEEAWDRQAALLRRADGAGVPTAGLHLDRWFGLDRQHQVDDEPFFDVSVLFTADGGHDEEWRRRRIDHRWMPPAVSAVEAGREGRVLSQYRADVAFVGSWSRYHAEYPERRDLVLDLRRRYRNRFKVWPRGRTAIRGQDLADLYRTAKVIVGDSCLAPATNGTPIERYWSDRIPETLGRGGFLLHPYVPGIEDHFTDGEHLRLYRDRAELHSLIRYYLDHDGERRAIADAGRDHVRSHHTYAHRIEEVVSSIEDLSGNGRTRFRRGRISATFECRPDSSDRIVIDETWDENVYRLAPEDLLNRTVVDLGANIGAFSIFAALSGAHGVYAYEPDPANRERLRLMIEANGLTGEVSVFEEAVLAGDVTEIGWYESRLGAEGSAQVARRETDITVPAVGLDEVVRRAGHVGVMKIDVEGAESKILTGAADETWERIDRIVMEFHGVGTGSSLSTEEWDEMLRALAERGHVRILGRPSNGGMIWWDRY